MPRRHLIFDVNETLLDLSALDPVFDDAFDRPGLRAAWFTSLLHWSTVTTLTGQYKDFGALAGDCLDHLAAREQLTLRDDQRRQIFDTIVHLAPHPEAVRALRHLRRAGFTLMALTNSAQATVDTQFANAHLTDLFDHVLSVDAARCYKPHPNAYALASGTLGCAAADLRLIAAHDWDVTGALRAGMHAAFVARDGATLNPAGDTPDIIGADLVDVASQIIEIDG